MENDNLLKILVEGRQAKDSNTRDIIVEKISKLTKELLHDLEIDFQNIIDNATDFAAVLGRESNFEDFQDAFFKESLSGLSSGPKAFFQDLSEEKDNFFYISKEVIEGYGSKLYMVWKNNYCVSEVYPIVCKECFFKTVCRIKED